MGLFAKLFGSKSAPAASTHSAEEQSRADDPRAVARRCLDEVESILATTEDMRVRTALRAEMAIGLSRIDADGALAELGRAMEEALALVDPAMAVGVLESVLRGLERSARGSARVYVQAVIDQAAGIESNEERRHLLGELAPVIALAGDAAGALDAADAIDDSYFAAEARAAVVEVLCEEGEIAAAESAVEKMRPGAALSRARKALARALARAGAIDEASEIAKLIQTSPWREAVAADLALARAQRGDFEGGLALARAIADPLASGAALVELAELSMEAGELERAEEVIASVVELEPRALGFAKLAAAHARAGDLSAADEALARIETRLHHALASIEVADSAAARARPEDRSRYLQGGIASVVAANGPEAVRYQRPLALRILSRAGNLAEALELATGARGAENRQMELREIARSLASNADVDGIDVLAGKLDDPVDRAGVLVSAAFGLLVDSRERE